MMDKVIKWCFGPKISYLLIVKRFRNRLIRELFDLPSLQEMALLSHSYNNKDICLTIFNNLHQNISLLAINCFIKLDIKLTNVLVNGNANYLRELNCSVDDMIDDNEILRFICLNWVHLTKMKFDCNSLQCLDLILNHKHLKVNSNQNVVQLVKKSKNNEFSQNITTKTNSV